MAKEDLIVREAVNNVLAKHYGNKEIETGLFSALLHEIAKIPPGQQNADKTADEENRVYIKMQMPKTCGECRFCRPKSPYPCYCYANWMLIKPSETDLRDGLSAYGGIKHEGQPLPPRHTSLCRMDHPRVSVASFPKRNKALG